MRVLLIGGTGLISRGITEQLQARDGVDIVHFNRGSREAPRSVSTIVGDRRSFAEFERQMREAGEFDCVIDMIAFQEDEIDSAIRAFSGRIGQYIMCSTTDVYTKDAGDYPVDERHGRLALPSFPYAYNKVKCENKLLSAHDAGHFPVTIIRPAQTYGDLGYAVTAVGNWLYLMRRLRESKPIIVHGDGSSLWSVCHRDDVARAFVNAIRNPAAYGQCYNATGEEWMTHDQYWRTIADALGAAEPQLVHIPTDLLKQALPNRADWCSVNFRHVTIFNNDKAKRDLGFRYTITWSQGISEVIRRLDERGLIQQAPDEPYYDALLGAWEDSAARFRASAAGLDS